MNTAQSIEQLKHVVPMAESPWIFLAHLPFTQEAYTFYMLILGGLVGAIINWLTKWAKGEIKGGLWSYLVVDNPRRSVLSIISMVGELVGEMGSGLFTTSDGAFVGWGLVLLTGFKTGFIIDSIVNKAERPEWTPAQRAAVEEVPKSVQPVVADKP